MRKSILLFVALASLTPPWASSAEQQSAEMKSAEMRIEIFSPKEGQTLKINVPPVVDYHITLSGDSFGNRQRSYIYVDGQKKGKLRQMTGQYALDKFPLGKHEICIKVDNETPDIAGVQQCVKVDIEAPRDAKDPRGPVIKDPNEPFVPF